jgi:endonuclease/exonuclease/phosphatase family metal-dependent hydrolase
MPLIKVLSWNIENLGPSAMEKAIEHGASRFNYIALMIATSDADIVCLQEIVFGMDPVVPQVNLQYIVDTVNKIAIEKGLTARWAGAGEAAFEQLGGKNYEGYAFLWKPTVVTPRKFGLYQNLPGNSGVLPSNGGEEGRGATYMLATPDGSQNTYLIMNYHAPSKSPGNTVALEQMTTILNAAISGNDAGWGAFYPALTANPTGCIICGDFNVDYGTNPGKDAYQALARANQSLLTSVTSPTSLTAIATPQQQTNPKTLDPGALAGATSTAEFLASAYDHFLYGGADVTEPYKGQVLNCMDLNLTNDNFTILAGQLINAGAWQTQTIANDFTQSDPGFGFTPNYQSFIVYRYAVSDHLPILGYFTLT